MFNLRLTPIVKKLLILNVGLFLLQSLIPIITPLFSLYHFKNIHFYPFQFITYMFLHADLRHLLFNMLPIIFFAPYLEELLGQKKFLLLYLVCGLGAGLLHTGILHYELVQRVATYSIEYDTKAHWDYINNSNNLMLGASGAVYGVLMASAMYFPNSTIVLFPIPIPLKLKYLVAFYAATDIYSIINVQEGDNVAHFAHIGGMIFAYLLIKYWRKYN